MAESTAARASTYSAMTQDSWLVIDDEGRHRARRNGIVGECGSERSALVDVREHHPVRWREICDGRKHVIVFGDMPPSEGSHDGTDGITVAYSCCVRRRVAHMGSIARKGIARKGVQGIRVTAGPFRPLWSSRTWGRSTSWRRCYWRHPDMWE